MKSVYIVSALFLGISLSTFAQDGNNLKRRGVPSKMEEDQRQVRQASESESSSLEERLSALEESYAKVDALQGRFEQRFKSQRFPARTAKGTIFFHKPNRMRWNYSDPEGKIFLLDGDYLYLLDPLDEQILKAKQPGKDELPLALALLSGRTKVRDHFNCQWESEKDIDRTSEIRCLPKEEIPNVSAVILQLTDAAQPTIRRSVIVDKLGNENELIFQGLELNPTLPAEIFEFTPPKGIPVVEMDVDEIQIQ